jgi:poly-gamma-glutamate synthesis protein (capsule biosynthesis protein)
MKRVASGLAVVIIALVTMFAGLSPRAEAPSPTTTPPVAAPAPTSTPAPTPTATPTALPTPEPTPEPTPTPPVVIAIGGDVLTGEKIGPRIVAGEYEDVLDSVTAERFRAADVAIVNLETSVSTRGTAVPGKAYTFRSPPENLAFLRDWLGLDAVGLSNNHTLDFGWDAFYDTLEHTREYGITPFGAGNDLAEAAAPYIAEAAGLKIAFFASNQILPAGSWSAGAEKAGQLVSKDPNNLGALAEGIAAARETCDYVIVYMHWGIERDSRPNDTQKRTAHALIDLGADVVVGAHPHVIQSFEYYNGKPIIYSLGNFIFNSRNPETAVMFLTIEDGKISVEIVPCRMKGTLTYAVYDDDAAALLSKWSALSYGCTLGADGRLNPDIAIGAE